MITLEKLRIFDKYDGDVDQLARIGRNYEKSQFDKNDWSIIDNICQNIELINKGLVAQNYLEKTLKSIKENCDQTSFDILTSKINFYNDFQRVSEILKQIKELIKSDSDTVWGGYENAGEFLAELNKDIEQIEVCDFNTLNKVQSEFLPASTYQEISVSNDWSDNFLFLAEDFDKLYKRIKEVKTAHNNSTLPKAGRNWWKRLFGSK
jgi:hypothetical protein